MKILVVYYSRTGKTRQVAEEIAESLNGDIEEIRDKRDRVGVLGFLRSGYEALTGKLTEIQPISRKPGEYELTIVGSPVWAGRLPSPTRAFLVDYGGEIKNAAFFATCLRSSGRIFTQMEELTKPPIATLEVKDEDIKSNRYLEKIKEFAEKVKETLK